MNSSRTAAFTLKTSEFVHLAQLWKSSETFGNSFLQNLYYYWVKETYAIQPWEFQTLSPTVCINGDGDWKYLHSFSIQGRVAGRVGIINRLCTGSWFQDIKQVTGNEECAERLHGIHRGQLKTLRLQGSEFTQRKGNFN